MHAMFSCSHRCNASLKAIPQRHVNRLLQLLPKQGRSVATEKHDGMLGDHGHLRDERIVIVNSRSDGAEGDFLA